MNPFNELKEGLQKVNNEIGKSIKAFDNLKNDSESPRHINTINEKLGGKNHPESGVPYEKRVIYVNGKKVEGVFPVFESKINIFLPKELQNASDIEQFKYCTKQLAAKIERDPEFAKQFTPRQLEQIKAGSPRISGLTWHHSEEPGKMQLVDSKKHAVSSHTGGRSIWGGGSSSR